MKSKLLAAFLLGALLVQTGIAQSGYERIVLLAMGSYVATSVVSVSTTTATAIFPDNGKRVDMTCRNNSSYTVYIGTNAATTTLTGIGFPVLANESFELGSMSGELYGLSTTAAADVRCFEGAIR